MQKFLNDPERFVDEMLEGYRLAHQDHVDVVEGEPRALIGLPRPDGRVAIATGGGSGHLPLFLGYVGRGLVDGCAVGNLFASPSADQMLAVTHAIDSGRGVLYLYGNYGGDRMNFGAAAGVAESAGIRVESVRAADDVASAPPERAASRRGIAGIFIGYLVAAAAARRGWDLAQVAEVTAAALGRTRSMGVALAPSILPTVGQPNFLVPAGQMEIGMGIHGEPGVGAGPLRAADSIADDLVDRILADLDPAPASDVAVLVNGLGATPLEELYVLYRRVHDRLVSGGLRVRDRWVGEYATSLEMAGASVSIIELDAVTTSLIDEGGRLLRS